MHPCVVPFCDSTELAREIKRHATDLNRAKEDMRAVLWIVKTEWRSVVVRFFVDQAGFLADAMMLSLKRSPRRRLKLIFCQETLGMRGRPPLLVK
jgi:hypothetical protein